MTEPGAIAQLVAQWAHVYSDQKIVSAVVIYLHLSGILLGGGAALTADREALQIARDGKEWSGHLQRWSAVHRWVVAGLAITMATGVMMLLADLPTFLPSVLYWAKMSLVAVLLANGYVRLRAERVLLKGDAAGLPAFRRTSIVSIVLWFSILLAGAMLSTVS